MRTVPLSGKKAAGRVALVDDGDYDLVMQHRWHVVEPPPKPGWRQRTPYAETVIWMDGRQSRPLMHTLLTGFPLVDHVDHYGLNNQRYNLRPATKSQNGANQLPRSGCSSQYKGVYWSKRHRKWSADLGSKATGRHLGLYVSEMAAALAYDEAARIEYDEYAWPNFPDGISQVVLGQLRAVWAAEEAAEAASRQRGSVQRYADWWAQREPETRTCATCGKEYQTKSTRPGRSCGSACRKRAARRRERELKGTLP